MTNETPTATAFTPSPINRMLTPVDRLQLIAERIEHITAMCGWAEELAKGNDGVGVWMGPDLHTIYDLAVGMTEDSQGFWRRNHKR